MLRAFFLLLTTLLTVLVAADPAAAKTRIVPRDYDTIQEAVDASNDGDKVIVRKGTYAENVVIEDLTDFKIETENKPVIDPNGVGTAITVIHCRDIKVRNFRIENTGEDGIRVIESVDVQLKNIRVRDCAGTAIKIRGGRTFDIYKARIDGCGEDGIYLGTSEGGEPSRRANVQRCRIENVEGYGVNIDGQIYHSVRKNRIYDCGWGIFFSVNSESSRADRNRVEDCTTGAISVNGTRNFLRRNNIKRTGGDAILVLGEQCWIEFNKVKETGRSGFLIAGRDCTLRNNKSKDCGGDGLIVVGPDNLLRKTKVHDAQGRGVVADSTNSTFRRNKVKRAGTIGWFVAEGAVDNLFRRTGTSKSGVEGLVDENPEGSNTYEKSSFK